MQCVLQYVAQKTLRVARDDLRVSRVRSLWRSTCS